MQKLFQNNSKVLVDVNNSNNLLYLPIDKILQAKANNDESDAGVK
jgi:hypothetical protein